MKVYESYKQVITRFIIFTTILLLAVPLWFSTFLNIHYVWGIRASFLMLKIFKLATISLLILLFITRERVKTFKFRFDWRQAAIFGVLALLFFHASFHSQSDMQKIASHKPSISEDSMNFDGGRLLALKILGDEGGAFEDAVIYDDAVLLKKEFNLASIPENPSVVWHSSWKDSNNNELLDSRITFIVNNQSFDITEKYSSLESNHAGWLEKKIPKEVLQEGKNELIIQKIGSSDNIIITSQDIYQEDNSYLSEDSAVSWQKHWRELLLYPKTEENFFQLLLFKLGFIFKILGIISLFLAVFGLRFGKYLLKNSWIEFLFSTVFAYWIYWFSEFVKSQWYFFSSIVAKVLYFLFNIFTDKVFIRLTTEYPVVGIQGFIAGIYDVCSGVDSMGFFTLAYFILIILYWKKITFWKALLMFVPGLLGIFLLNILRVLILILIGANISSDFAINAFHTNAGMVFSIIYFVLYLPLALKFIEKKAD